MQQLQVKYDAACFKSLLKAKCVPEMKQGFYTVMLILNNDGDILQAFCQCPAGKGPKASCKHTAALCYAIEDFVKTFVKTENAEACTEKLQMWNKPRPKKLAPLPIHAINFEKQKYGKVTKEIKGKNPSHYELDKLCQTDIACAKTFLADLKEYEEDSGRQVGLLKVIDEHQPLVTSSYEEPKCSQYCSKVVDVLEKMKVSAIPMAEKTEKVLEAMKVLPEQRLQIEKETREQSSSVSWHKVRDTKITGSICHSVCTFTGRSTGQRVVQNIIKRKHFQTAATEFGIQNEDLALDLYSSSRKDDNVTVGKAGFYIHLNNGYMGASPDAVITESDGTCGLAEIKCPPKWSDKHPSDAVLDKDYPLKKTANGIKMKQNNRYYHQVQFQLQCCSDFAKYCDFIICHVGLRELQVVRVEPDPEWVSKYIPKIENFYKSKVIPEILM